MYVTKFQKLGLPHIHMLLILHNNNKLSDSKDYDSIVKTEISKKEEEPQFHDVVPKHLIHDFCETLNPKSSCMKHNQCKKRFPKNFLKETRQGNDSYPQYKRRFDEPISTNRNLIVENI